MRADNEHYAGTLKDHLNGENDPHLLYDVNVLHNLEDNNKRRSLFFIEKLQ